MSCRNWEIEISALADSNLEPDRVPQVQGHLGECRRCQALYLELTRLNQLLRHPGLELDPPGRIWNRIASEIEKKRRQVRQPIGDRLWGRISLPRPALALAATLILVILLSLMVWRQEDGPAKQYLAELDSYSLSGEGNPFYAETIQNNPFFQYQQVQMVNPFDSSGSVR